MSGNSRCLVIGYGSIGRRHVVVLTKLGYSVFLVTSQEIENYPCYSRAELAINEASFDYVVIANPTHLHFSSLKIILYLNFQGPILVEKPLFSRLELLEIPKVQNIFTAYNLRFHELLIRAKEMLENEEMIAFSARVGQYLPTWRKGIDYRDRYSAKRELGGGVLRELSHELDYALWFCGPCGEVVAAGGHLSELEIECDDIFSLMMRCEKCPIVNLQLDFLSRVTRRDIVIQTTRHTFLVDLITGKFCIDGEVKYAIIDGILKTYEAQHRAILSGKIEDCCDYQQGLSVLKLIEAAELSMQEKRWVQL